MVPKVSVIIATYNCGNYIDKCLYSMLNQTYKNIEIIICDDASSDNTSDILKKYSNDNRITILKNGSNLFAGATRNKCIQKSTGEYIAIQDADDYSSLDRLEKQVNFLVNNTEYDFVGSAMHQFDDNGIWETSKKKEVPTNEDFLFATPFAHATLLIRREVILSIEAYRISKETRRVEDYDMIMRMFAKGYRGYNLQEALYFYRVDKNTMKRRKYKYRIDEAIVRYKCFRALELLPKGYLYIIKPLVVGLIPARILIRLKKIIRDYAI